MGLGFEVRKRMLAHLIKLYQACMILCTIVFSVYGVLRNILYTNNYLASLISGLPIIGMLMSLIYFILKPPPKVSLRIQLFYTTTLLLVIITLLLQLFWGSIIPFLPYLFTITILHLLLSYRLRTAQLYTIIYTLLLVLQLFNILPIIKLSVWYDIKPTTKLINTVLATILSMLLFFISKIAPLTGLWYIITPRTKCLIQDIFLDGAKFRLIQHRIRNLLQTISVLDQRPQLIYQILTGIFALSDSASSKHFDRQLMLLKDLYPSKKLVIHSTTNQYKTIIDDLPPITIIIILDLIHNALKHAKNKVELIIEPPKTSYIVFKINNDHDSKHFSDYMRFKEYSIFSEIPILLEAMKLGKFNIHLKPSRTEITMKLKRHGKQI